MQPTEAKPPQGQKTETSAHIVLPVNQRPVQNASIPVVFHPLRENISAEFSINHTIDLTMFRQPRAPARPAAAAMRFSPDAGLIASFHLPFAQKPYPIARMIVKDAVLRFLRERETDGVRFSKEAVAVITQQVSVAIFKLMLAASQASRKRVNMYAKPMSDRRITLSPEVSLHFLTLEIYYMNMLRRRAFISSQPQQDPDNEDPYHPIFASGEPKKAELFPPDGSNESLESKHQTARFCNTLKEISKMISIPSKEKENSSFACDAENLSKKYNTLTQTKQNQYNPHATDVFGCKAEEEQNITNRKIEPKDVFYSLQFFPAAIRTMEQYLRAEHIKGN